MKQTLQLTRHDAEVYGAKAANLAHLQSINEDLGFKVPWGFVYPEDSKVDLVESRLFCFTDDNEKIIVRSSFVGEDSANDSMAGKFTSIVCDKSNVAEAVKEVFASGPANMKKNTLIQPYIKAVTSGEFFTYNPDNGPRDTLWSCRIGNGGTVDGKTDGYGAAPQRFLDIKDQMVIHYLAHLDIEWVIDEFDRLWVVQVRPITRVAEKKEEILHGLGILNEYAVGTAVVLEDYDKYDGVVFESDYILVAPHTNRKWENLMRGAKGLITDHGTNTCHASIFAREIGLPAVIGTIEATKKIKTGDRLYINTLDKPGFGIVKREVYRG